MGGGSSKPEIQRKTYGSLDLDKFLGTWYEIAHVPSWFQRNCENAIAYYYREPDGTIRLLNTCYKGGMRQGSMQGTIRIPDPDSPSKLQVKFDAVTSVGWGDYWVYDVKYDSYAIVGNTSGQVWILSRSPTMTFCLFKDLSDKAFTLGFDVTQLKVDLNVLKKC